MQRSQVVLDIGQFVRQNYLLDNGFALGETDKLIATGAVDSTGILELITFLEEKYALHFEDEELTAENFESIACIADFVLKKRSADHAR